LSCIAHGLLESMPDRRRSPPAAGVLLSLPLALMAARNLAAGLGLAGALRACSSPLCRSFHPVIAAILFVKAVGFGALAGVLAPVHRLQHGLRGRSCWPRCWRRLDEGQVEAVRATGAGFLQRCWPWACCRRSFARFIGFWRPTSSTPTCATPRWSGIVAAAASARPSSPAYQRFDYRRGADAS
jgi:phosphonate transport system permease protein